jgi:two-component system sensor histidine kinase PilS (NtrC family)
MPSPPSALNSKRTLPPSDLAWRVVGLVNLYRVLVAAGLLVLAQFAEMRTSFGVRHAGEFTPICVAWLAAGFMLVLIRRRYWPNTQLLSLAHVLIDSAGIGAILWATGGVASGLGILLILPVGAMAVLATNLHAIFLAALASIVLLLQQVASYIGGAAQPGDFVIAGVLGAVVFLVALLVRPLTNRLSESEALLRRQEVDLANLAQLSQYIVQHLRESIIVVDEDDRIRLINESAAQMLGDHTAWPGALLGEVSPRLLFLLTTWRGHSDVSARGPGTLAAADGARVIQPHFAALGAGSRTPVLIFLEDTGLLAERVQQSKLAGLGRLSASIAHEIRNPVGAMSHAAQLLQESPQLGEADRRLTEIIRGNAVRISRIVENVLQFSRRGTSKPERVVLQRFLAQFQTEFCATLELPPETLVLRPDAAAGASLDVRADPTQLNQILWNLCQNAVTHARGAEGTPLVPVELQFGRLASNGRPYVEVADRGPGIDPEDAERVFEPFFTRSPKGTGLGLFLARELAQTNGATLLHEPRAGGGSLFRIVFTDPGRWEAAG